MKSRSKKPEAASAAHAPAHDQGESVGEIEEAKGEDEDGLKSLKNSPMDGENKLDNEDAHPVSGTSPLVLMAGIFPVEALRYRPRVDFSRRLRLGAREVRDRNLGSIIAG